MNPKRILATLAATAVVFAVAAVTSPAAHAQSQIEVISLNVDLIGNFQINIAVPSDVLVL